MTLVPDRCLICDAPVIWALTDYGRPVTVDTEPSDDGVFVFTRPGRVRVIVPKQVPARTRYTPHEQTCLRVPL